MRPEVSNELLLQVLQAWDPDEENKWSVHPVSGSLLHDVWGVRHDNGEMFCHAEESAWYKACELVEFLLKDRPDLNKEGKDIWNSEILKDCRDNHGTSWAINPWTTNLDSPTPSEIAGRIKAYEYLREWKESQEPRKPLRSETLALPLPIPDSICPSDVTLSIDGQTIEGMAGEWKCRRHPDESDSEYRARLESSLVSPPEVPTTYEKICPHCDGSKEVTGWLGKEVCNAC